MFEIDWSASPYACKYTYKADPDYPHRDHDWWCENTRDGK